MTDAMRWAAPPRLAFLSWLLVAGAAAPLLVVEADLGGCDHIGGVDGAWSRCVELQRTLSYRAIGLHVQEERAVNGEAKAGAEWTALWSERSGPLSILMAFTGATALAAATLFPLLHRRPRPRAGVAAWWTMAAGLAVFLLAALAHARLNGADRGWPSWGLLLATCALASGLVLRTAPQEAASGPMPALPTF